MQIQDRVQSILGISGADRQKLPENSPTPIFVNYVAFALKDLQPRGLIEKVGSRPNTYRITDTGLAVLQNGTRIDLIPKRPASRRQQSRHDESTGDRVDDSAQPRGAPLDTARPFDPSAPPRPSEFSWVLQDQETTHQLREKARQAHHDILAGACNWLRENRWTDIEEIPGSIDLWAVDPDGTRWIFEAKTIRDENQLSQTRSGLAQLLEYRLQYGSESDALCLLLDRGIPEGRATLLEDLGIGVGVVTDGELLAANGQSP
jgi:hypothetical protein